MKNLKKQAEDDLEQLRSELTKKFTGIMNMIKLENECMQTIVAKQQEEVMVNRVRYKQAKALLNCPRAHHKYIEEYGIHKFILQCQHVTEESERLKNALDGQTKRLSVRNFNASTE